jgi:hypothetical protein
MNDSTLVHANPSHTQTAVEAFAPDLLKLATAHRVNLHRDRGDGTDVILGRCGQIFEYSESHFAVMLLLDSARAWTFARQRLIAAGCEVFQLGDSEGSARFLKSNMPAIKQAIREAKICAKRRPSAGQLQVLKANAFGRTGGVRG